VRPPVSPLFPYTTLFRSGRPPLRSPGRPPVNRREEQQRFWRKIAEGLTSEDAAVACGVSQPLGPRWFREGGGMPPISLDPPSGRSEEHTSELQSRENLVC